MRLLVDIGNTRVKWAVASIGGSIVASGVTIDDWSDLEEYASRLDGGWVSCVGKSSTLKLVSDQLYELFGLDLNVAVVSAAAGGLVNNYNDQARLGVDRWVAAIGARVVEPQGALIVVDAGTAVTIDYISEDSVYQGGVILPGFTMMHDSLVGRTAGIQSERQYVDSVIGKTTQECVNSGAQFGLVGAIERVIDEMLLAQGDENTRLLITGGDAEAIAAMSGLRFNSQANLIFDGLIRLSQAIH